jgi:hypothetical protein
MVSVSWRYRLSSYRLPAMGVRLHGISAFPLLRGPRQLSVFV